jgi:hypothetical protein
VSARRRSVLALVVVLTLLGCNRNGVSPMSNTSATASRCPVTAAQVAEYEDRERIVAGISARIDADFDAGMQSLHDHESCRLDDLTRDLYAMAWRRGRDDDDPARRRRFVDVLVGGAVEQQAFLAGQAIKFLMDFVRADMGEQAWAALRALPFEGPNVADLVRLVGHLQMSERREQLAAIAQQPVDGYGRPPWVARLVLARMGDDEALREVIATVRAEPEIVTRATVLFADLAYTRQPAAFDVLREYLHSEERLPQLKDTVPGAPEARYAATAFAQHAVGCPVSGDDVRDADVPTIRTWADAQTSWDLR